MRSAGTETPRLETSAVAQLHFCAHTQLLCLIALQTAAREAEILAEVGEGGFAAQEFELVEQIGQLSWVRGRKTSNFALSLA